VATFELQGPDGGTYQVDAPDAASAVAALHGGGTAAPAPPATPQFQGADPWNHAIGPGVQPYAPAPSGPPSPLGGRMPTAADLAAQGYGRQPGIGAEVGAIPASIQSAAQVADPVIRSAASGATRGYADRLAAGLGSRTGVGGTQGDYAGNLENERSKTGQFQEQHPYLDLAGNTAGTLATLGATGLGSLGAGGGLGARIGGGAATGAGIGAIQGASQSPDLTDVGQTGRDMLASGLLGAGAGGVVGGAVPALGAVAGRAITPFEPDANRLAMVKGLRDAGVTPTAGQATGSQGLQKIEAGISDIPFAGGGANAARIENNKAFTAAIMEKAGAPPGSDASPASLNAAHEALGAQFDALGARNSIKPDAGMIGDMKKAIGDYSAVTGTPAPGIAKIADDLSSSPEISGDKYLNMRSQLGKTAQSLKYQDPAQSSAYSGVQDALDDAMERSIAAKASGPAPAGASSAAGPLPSSPWAAAGDNQFATTVNRLRSSELPKLDFEEGGGDQFDRLYYAYGKMYPDAGSLAEFKARMQAAGIPTQEGVGRGPNQFFSEPNVVPPAPSAEQAQDDLGAFQDVRSKYRNLVAIEHAATSAGADAAGGILSPQQMRTALASGGNRRSYARGIGDLAPLTNAGNAILTNVPQSGTAPRLLAARLLHGGEAGAGIGFLAGGPAGATVGGPTGAIANAVVPPLIGRTIMSRPMQSYLANQLVPGIGRNPNISKLAAALAAYGGKKAADSQRPDIGVQTGGQHNPQSK
jgi:hypothetical protein